MSARPPAPADELSEVSQSILLPRRGPRRRGRPRVLAALYAAVRDPLQKTRPLSERGPAPPASRASAPSCAEARLGAGWRGRLLHFMVMCAGVL